MSDFMSSDEVNLMLNSDIEESDLSALKDAFKSCMDVVVETLASLTNEPSVKYKEPLLRVIKASEVFSGNEKIAVKIDFKTGIKGYSFLSLTEETCKVIAGLMMGLDDVSDLDDDTIYSANQEAMNQMMGGACTALSRSIDDTIDISTPNLLKTEDFTVKSLFSGAIKDDSDILEINYPIDINETTQCKICFVFTLSTARTAAFKAKTTESKNLLRLNPELSKSIAEYFALLASKYKAIYSMIGVIDIVSVSELNSIHSLQCLDVDVINNYNVLNKNTVEDFYNIYIFEKNFVEDMKKVANLFDDEESTWDILRELNNQFTYIFLEYCSDSNLVFNNIDCNNFLELPDNQYLLITFNVGHYKFYQLLSFSLINKLKINLNRSAKPKINLQTIENSENDSYNSPNVVVTLDEVGQTIYIPEIFKKLPVEVSAILGEKEYTIKDLLHFSPGYIIHFDRKVTENIDIYIDNFKKAEGEVGQLTYNKANNYAVKIKKFKKE